MAINVQGHLFFLSLEQMVSKVLIALDQPSLLIFAIVFLRTDFISTVWIMKRLKEAL